MSLTIIDQTRNLVNVPNFVTNGDGAQGTTNWTEGYYTAATRPSGSFTAASGTGNFTVTSTTTTPLGTGTTSLLFTKSAVNAQGKCAQYEFDLPLDYRAKVLQLSIDYIVVSGTFTAGSSTTDSSMIWYCSFYDGSTWTVSEPTTFKMFSNSTTLSDVYRSNIQTPYNATKMRLIAYVAETASTAFSLKAICLVSPSQYVYGTPITDWQTFTPTITASTPPSLGTGATQNGRWRRVGENIEIQSEIVGGTGATAGSGTYYWLLPNNLTINTSKIASPQNAAGIFTPLGQGVKADSGGVSYLSYYVICDGSTSGVSLSDVAGNIISSASSAMTAGRRYSFSCFVPVTGYSSNVQMSDTAWPNVITCSYNKSATQAVTADVTNITFPNKTFDTTASFDGTTFTAPVVGYYQITGAYVTATTAAGFSVFAWINAVKNIGLGSNNSNGGSPANLSGIVQLNAGDALTFRSNASVTLSGTGYLQIQKLSGPTTIGANDTVAASYWLSANFAASTTVPINFDSREYDYTGSVQTSATAWRFTAPISGLYEINGLMNVTTAASYAVNLYKNGSQYKTLCYGQSGAMSTPSNLIRLVAGDYIDLRPSTSISFAGGLLATSGIVNVQITKIGMY